MKPDKKADLSKKARRRQKIIAEMKEYFINVVYLALFFSMFTWYRRLILAQYQISYLEYGTSLIEALILAKVVMIGDMLHLGQRLKDKPLILLTLYKSVVFTIWVAIFSIIEHAIGGLLTGKGLVGGIDDLITKDKYELFARCLIVFYAFLPFFAFKELKEIVGENKIRHLFFRKNQ